MQKMNLLGYQVKIDGGMTKAWYAKAGEWDCECGDCCNFLELAHRRELPASIIETL